MDGGDAKLTECLPGPSEGSRRIEGRARGYNMQLPTSLSTLGTAQASRGLSLLSFWDLRCWSWRRDVLLWPSPLPPLTLGRVPQPLVQELMGSREEDRDLNRGGLSH